MRQGIACTKHRSASGETVEYFYAWRGGPRLTNPPGSAGFEREYAAICAAHKQALRRPKKRLLTATPAEEDTASARLLKYAQKRAAARGLPCTPTKAEIRQKILDQRFRCIVTDLRFNMTWSAASGFSMNAYGPSLDRIDNAGGYTAENTRLVLVAVNAALNEWGLDTFLVIAEAALARRAALAGDLILSRLNGRAGA